MDNGELIQAQAQNNQLRQEEITRKELAQHARHIECCDGAVRHQVRDWLAAVSAAKKWTGATDALIIKMVGYLSRNALNTSISTYVENIDPAVGATWEGVKEHVTSVFLDEDEGEHLRNNVDALKQTAYQDSREYGQKYLEAVQKAYTLNERRVPLVLERLVKNFINGLRDKQVRTQVFLSKPPDLEAAVARANAVARAVSLSESIGGEEPMEIGAMPIAAREEPKPDMADLLKELVGSMRGIQKQLGRVERQGHSGQRRSNPGPRKPNEQRNRKKFGKPSFNADGTPNCYECGKSGHFARDCSNRKQIAASENQ